MKMFLATLLMILGGSFAQAQMSGAAACARLNVADYKIRCFEIVSRSYHMDGFAVKACDRIQSQQLTVDCMQAISNKRYTSYEVQACDSLYSAEETISCFRRLGHGGGGYPVPNPYPNPYPHPVPNPNPYPSPGGHTCTVRELGYNRIPMDQFFSRASQRAQQSSRCVIAKVSYQASSGRIYGRNGARIAKERGGLSNNEVDQVVSQYGLYNCLRMTCDRN